MGMDPKVTYAVVLSHSILCFISGEMLQVLAGFRADGGDFGRFCINSTVENRSSKHLESPETGTHVEETPAQRCAGEQCENKGTR